MKREIISEQETKTAAIKTVVCDPLEEQAAVLMSPNNEMLSYATGLAWRVVDDGGNIIRDETDIYVANYGEIKEGECVVSCGGKLPFSHVIHAVHDPETASTDLLNKVLQNTFKLAEKLKKPTLLIPCTNSTLKTVTGFVTEYLNSHENTCLFTVTLAMDETPDVVTKETPKSPVKRSNNVKYHLGCPTDGVKDAQGNHIIAHFVTGGSWSSRGCMGRITKAFGASPSAAFAGKTSPKKLGTVEMIRVKPSVYIYSLVLLQLPGPTISTDHLSTAFDILHHEAVKHNSTVHLHRPLESAISNLDWSKAHKLLTHTFRKVKVLVYTSQLQDLEKYSGGKRGGDAHEDAPGGKRQKMSPTKN
eukprot:TRINITY_DN9505_c0_g1_i1.p2 TRINITY_DN9505_c0_g1~~TRINITY_DN9505_c0_g1_i1.p2  ORF type:complete len:383 (+),score=66.87 TRINITY_DN9505_c0_g1_i1:72-1151(+)